MWHALSLSVVPKAGAAEQAAVIKTGIQGWFML
jgi:hypothetical protein